jgi:hypothetical protein
MKDAVARSRLATLKNDAAIARFTQLVARGEQRRRPVRIGRCRQENL